MAEPGSLWHCGAGSAVCGRGRAVVLFENLYKVIAVGIPDIHGDFRDGELRGSEELRSFFGPQLCKEPGNAFACLLFESA